MPECPIDQAQNGIIANILANGTEAPNLLSRAYSNDEIVGAAMKSMAFNSTHGEVVRSMVIKTIGLAGDIGDANNVLLPLLNSSRAGNRAKYTSHTSFGTGKITYLPDQNEMVRVNTILAIANIVHRESGLKKIAGGLGETMVSAALLDPSEQVRTTAAHLIGSRGTRPTITLLTRHLVDADSSKDDALYARAESAIKIIVQIMKGGKISGTFMTALLGLSNCGEEGEENRLWKLAEDSLVELYDAQEGGMQDEIRNHVLIENAKLRGVSDRDVGNKRELIVKRYGQLLARMGMEGVLIKPRKRLKPTKPMRPPAKMREMARPAVDTDEPYVSRGPAVELARRLGRGIAGAFRKGRGPRK